MRLRIAYRILSFIGVGFFLLLNGCSTDETVIYKDIIAEFPFAEKLEITGKVDINDSTGVFYDYGWYNSEISHRWSKGLKSKLTFVAKANSGDVLLKLRCRQSNVLNEIYNTFDINSRELFYISKWVLTRQKRKILTIISNNLSIF